MEWRTPYRIAVAVVATILLLAGCDESDEIDRVEAGAPIDRDLEQIEERDTLVVLTTYNSTGYFLYRGQPMGYDYELLQTFAEEMDVQLKMRVLSSRDSIYYYLNQGEGDLVAGLVVPSAADSADVAFTRPLYETRPVLVQREPGEDELPESVDSIVEKGAPRDPDAPIADMADVSGDDSVAVSARLVRRPGELEDERVSLPQRSPYGELLLEISDTLTGDIHVVELDTALSEETVIRLVSAGDVNYTVSPQNLAQLKESYYTNIHIRPTLGPMHQVSWATRRNAPELREALNEWVEGGRDGELFNSLYQKYFVDRQGYRERVESKYLTAETGTLSDYDALFKRFAPEVGWDWRLLAAQTYQESRFEPRARSWAGAAGLLQLMPPTAREFGVSDVYNPEANVQGAVRFLQWLTDYWDDHIPDEQERMKFILASYNTGHGHVEDARRLTAKNGGDDTVWADVAYWLLQKSKRQVYEDPVVKYGFSRGLEPVNYVAHILERYEHYRQFVIDEPSTASATDRSRPENPQGP